MSTRNNTIELNGKRYDARTGKLLSGHDTTHVAKSTHKAAAAPAKKPAVHTAQKGQKGASIDGVVKRTAHTAHNNTVAKQPAKPAHHPKAEPKVAARAVHKKTGRSNTLMRHAVKKPTAAPKAAVKRRTTPHVEAHPHRVSRAQKIEKSKFISKFGNGAATLRATRPAISELPVQPEPNAQPGPVLDKHHEDQLDISVHWLQKAIDSATSHTQPRPKKTTRRQKVSKKLRLNTRTANVAAASLAIVLLFGFIAYQNAPNLNMQIAANRSGVAGSLPGYQPAGFALHGPIQYSSGQITVGFKSHSDDRLFNITQSASQWNSETLRENFVASESSDYQTFQTNGKTVYVYDSNNATWVDGGVWYRIDGDALLNNDQLLRIAASM